METSLIEQLDKTRYNLLKWITIGWGTWFATVIGNSIIHGHIIIQIAFWIGLAGNTIFIINLIKFMKLGRQLRKDPKLHDALEDELHHFNIGKSYTFSYWTVIGATGILLVVNSFASLSALVTAELILYVGVMAFFCSSLYYNRD
ncbi:MAG: hypothetical protein ACM3P1_04165 [Candidatus Saccharibacteria bacterium]